MTVASNLSTISASIASLSLTGIINKGITAIPDTASMLTPIVFPQPNDYMTNVKPEFVSFGSNGTAKMDLSYTLNYVYLHCEIGSGLTTYDIYSALITNLVVIIVAIMSNDAITGLIDMQLGNISTIGAIKDPAGNQYFGVLFSLNILEHIQ